MYEKGQVFLWKPLDRHENSEGEYVVEFFGPGFNDSSCRVLILKVTGIPKKYNVDHIKVARHTELEIRDQIEEG